MNIEKACWVVACGMFAIFAVSLCVFGATEPLMHQGKFFIAGVMLGLCALGSWVLAKFHC